MRSAPGAEVPVYALFAGGGTAGHVLPGLAVAAELVSRGHDPESIHFAGSSTTSDRRLVTEAGFPFTGLPGRGIQRRFTSDNIRAVVGILAAVFRGVALVGRLRPKVVVAIGSYAAVPCTVGAVLFRVPIVVLARDARAGAADRLAGRFAKVCAVPFEQTDLPRAVVTGNPVRQEVLAVHAGTDMPLARTKLGLPVDRVVVAVFTGSLGSRRVNTAVRGLVDRWADRTDVAIRHAVGTRDWEEYEAGLRELPRGGLVYEPVSYEEHMELLLAAADVGVTRSGGATVAELAAVGLPAIMVPLPIAPRDHQTANANALVVAGAGVCVPDDELDTERLERELQALLDDPDRRLAMRARALGLGHPHAASAVADLVEKHASR